MAVKTLYETDTVVFGQEQDGFRALGIMVSLAVLAPAVAEEASFLLHERLNNAIARGTYVVVYERKDKASQLFVPLGYIVWGTLSRTAALVHKNGIRPLYDSELKSGGQLWLLDLCLHFADNAAVTGFLQSYFREFKEYSTLQMRNGSAVSVVTKL